MRLPRFMFAAAVLFWGWQWQLLWLATGMALGMELASSGQWQRKVSFELLCRVSNGCTLLFVAAAVFFAFTLDPAQSVLAVIKWAPILLLPLMFVIGIGGMAEVPLAIISSVVRRKSAADPGHGVKYYLAYPYLALWILATGVSNNPGPGFYIGMSLIAIWALWSVRPRARPPGLWAGLLSLAILGGAAVNIGLYRLHGIIEQTAMDWITIDSEEDPLRSETNLGHIGQLKLGNGIMLRIQTRRVLFEPLLLRTASFNLYLAPNWVLSGKHGFTWVQGQDRTKDWRTWHLTPGEADTRLEIDATATHINPIVALPIGGTQIESTHFQALTRNPMGTLQANMGRGHYHYIVHYQSRALDTTQPDAQDLALPANERALFQNLAQQLHLAGQPTSRALLNVRAHFQKNFRYSTFRQGNAVGQSALSDFLTHSRQGHCEHFASASVLLLRAAGIPARYAVGYSVQEPERFGRGYVVRQRHAHAWAMAYVDGAWQDFDSTPPSWGQQDASVTSWWEPVSDTLSWLMYQIRNGQIQAWQIALAILALVLWLRLKPMLAGWRKRVQPKPKGASQSTAPRTTPASAFQRIEQHLSQRGYPRQNGETLQNWLARISPHLGQLASAALAQVIELHYHYRFGPQAPADPGQLEQACRTWLDNFTNQPQKK